MTYVYFNNKNFPLSLVHFMLKTKKISINIYFNFIEKKPTFFLVF